MKKIAALLLFCAVLVSCSKDDPFTGVIVDGLYSYHDSSYAIAIGTNYKDGYNYESTCEPGYITVTDLSTGQYVFSQTKDIEPIEYDGYTGWRYNNGLAIVCVPNAEKKFTAKVVSNTSDIVVPDEMVFTWLK